MSSATFSFNDYADLNCIEKRNELVETAMTGVQEYVTRQACVMAPDSCILADAQALCSSLMLHLEDHVTFASSAVVAGAHLHIIAFRMSPNPRKPWQLFRRLGLIGTALVDNAYFRVVTFADGVSRMSRLDRI